MIPLSHPMIQIDTIMAATSTAVSSSLSFFSDLFDYWKGLWNYSMIVCDLSFIHQDTIIIDL